MEVKIGCSGSSTPDYLVECLNIDSEKAAKEAREKELTSINNALFRLFLLTEVSLGLAAPFFKSNEIGGQSFSKKIVAKDSSGISFGLILSLSGDRFCPNISNPALSIFSARGWSYSFSVIFHSPNKEIKFNLSKEELKSIQSTPVPGWALFKELCIESNGRLFAQMLVAIVGLSAEVKDFFWSKIQAIQVREGWVESYASLFTTNADEIVDWIMRFEETRTSYQKYQNSFLAYGPLISETCQALRDTKGFVKSKKLAEIRENLERKSKEILASVNT